jgi:hypothetical protein
LLVLPTIYTQSVRIQLTYWHQGWWLRSSRENTDIDWRMLGSRSLFRPVMILACSCNKTTISIPRATLLRKLSLASLAQLRLETLATAAHRLLRHCHIGTPSVCSSAANLSYLSCEANGLTQMVYFIITRPVI